MDPEAEAVVRAKEKSISVKRVAVEACAETIVRLAAKAEVRDWEVGVLIDVFNKFNAESNVLKRGMVGAEESYVGALQPRLVLRHFGLVRRTIFDILKPQTHVSLVKCTQP